MAPARLKRSWTPSGDLAPRQEEEDTGLLRRRTARKARRSLAAEMRPLRQVGAAEHCGSRGRRPETELRLRFCRGRPGGGREGTWGNDLASLVMSFIHLVLSRLCQALGSMRRVGWRPLRFGPPFRFVVVEDGRFFCPTCSVNNCPYYYYHPE